MIKFDELADTAQYTSISYHSHEKRHLLVCRVPEHIGAQPNRHDRIM